MRDRERTGGKREREKRGSVSSRVVTSCGTTDESLLVVGGNGRRDRGMKERKERKRVILDFAT